MKIDICFKLIFFISNKKVFTCIYLNIIKNNSNYNFPKFRIEGYISKGRSYSEIDQGYTYLQLLLNNKSDFLLVLSQHFNKVLRMEDVDWSQSKISFVWICISFKSLATLLNESTCF